MKSTLAAVFAVVFLFSSVLSAQDRKGMKELLIRCDDIGMCHSVNLAAEELIRTGIPFSTSVLFVCPWQKEAVNILKNHSQVTVGVHLAVNSEWKNYKWGPVAGRSAVPSLVDSDGYFFPTAEAFDGNSPKLNEIEKELRAQIERAFHSGLDIKYVDYHMGTLFDKPEYRAIVEKLAAQYHLGISEFLGEKVIESMYWTPIEKKADVLYKTLSDLSADSVNFLMCHIAVDSPESQALVDTNPDGLKEVSKNRQAELNALVSPRFAEVVRANNIKLINYSDLISRLGLQGAQKPSGSE